MRVYQSMIGGLVQQGGVNPFMCTWSRWLSNPAPKKRPAKLKLLTLQLLPLDLGVDGFKAVPSPWLFLAALISLVRTCKWSESHCSWNCEIPTSWRKPLFAPRNQTKWLLGRAKQHQNRPRHESPWHLRAMTRYPQAFDPTWDIKTYTQELV